MVAPTELQSVLFLCTFNAVRSVMAEALLKKYFGKEIYIQSAGVHAGEDADVFVTAALNEVGVNVSIHKPRALDELNEGSFDLIIALSKEAFDYAKEKTRTESVDIEFWPTYDATLTKGSRATKLSAYCEVRDQILTKIKDRFAK